jgi:hypothetical protein
MRFATERASELRELAVVVTATHRAAPISPTPQTIDLRFGWTF